MVLCGGGGAVAFLTLRDAETGEGAKEPAVAVDDFLTAVYQDRDADEGGRRSVCAAVPRRRRRSPRRWPRWRSTPPPTRTRGSGGPRPKVDNQTGDRATVSTRLTMTTADEKVGRPGVALHCGAEDRVGGSARSADRPAVDRLDGCVQLSGPADPAGTGWPARLHVVTGKGGTGKTSVAAALALALAAGGRRTLLVEVEGRQGIAQLFGTEPLPYEERRPRRRRRAAARCARSRWTPRRRCWSTWTCSTSWARRAGRCASSARSTSPPPSRPACGTCCSPARSRRPPPGRADGRRAYDAVVLDAPPTGRIGRFLNVTAETARLAKVGPIKTQSEGVAGAAALPDDRGARGDAAGGDAGPGDGRRDRRADRPRLAGRARSSSTPPARRCSPAGKVTQAELKRGLAAAGLPADRRRWPGCTPRRGTS